MGKIRIISGKFKSRLISFPDTIKNLRPTHDRIREDLFNWLMFNIENKSCLDLFAGSGAIGFEAISRNAKSVTMIEINKMACNALIKNKETLQCDNLNIINDDAIKYLNQCSETFDLIFLDPPYNSELLETILKIIINNRKFHQNTLIYLETNRHINITNFDIIKNKKTSNIHYMLIKVK
jgi:16S rRNA (guanine966-N2)-methyltransferase